MTGRLSWLVGAIIAAGAAVVAASLVGSREAFGSTQPWLPVALAALVAVGSVGLVRVRIRSTVVGYSWTDAAILVCIVTGQWKWLPVSVAAGVVVGKLAARAAPRKAIYNAAKDTLAASAGVAVALAFDVVGAQDPLRHVPELFVVALTLTVAEHIVGLPVVALSTNTPWHRVLRTNGGLKIALFLGKFVVAVLTVALIHVDQRLLAVVPPVTLCLHLLYATRLRTRTERAAWQRLAATTEELNATDLDAVLAAAVVNAADLFSADEAEVLVFSQPVSRLVRGDAEGVTWSGDPGQAPARPYDGESISSRLLGPENRDLGELRLHFRGPVTLTERERLTLRTFTSALRTAVRNAMAFAEAERLASRHAHAALHDPLTGLANRRRLHEYGDEVLAAGSAALVILDLDHFKEVNDTLGHLAGDRLLAEVSRRLARLAGSNDLVARLGGDEFAVLMVGLSPAEAERRARDLLVSLDAPIDLGGMRVRVDASGGVAVVEEAPAQPMVELLRRADVAMYQAKRGGRRIVRYEPERDTADVDQLTLGGELPKAIAEQEFRVSFQPIVDLATGQMISVEALARWHHPVRGDLYPPMFLGAIERSGLLPAFAEAMLDQALAAMVRWRAAGVDATVAVNASPRSLLDATYPQMVADRLAAHRLHAGDLVIELTESLSLGQLELVEGVLGPLHSAGVQLALDDFGTGSSSLAMLARVPVTELKIDRSFVAAMDTSPEAAAVVRSTIELGRSLNLLVVAEGVERESERRALWDLGCRAGQGHLFARPMPADDLLAALTAATPTAGRSGRFAAPLRPGGNVISLPRPRSTG